MKAIFALVLLFLVAVQGATLQQNMKSFTNFINKYGKSYSDLEFGYRFNVFVENMKYAAESQAKNPKATFGVTKFSDLTREEFAANYLMPKSLYANRTPNPAKLMAPLKAIAVPTSFDWSSKGAVTPVKNQGQCGSCWAFSATETIESFHKIGATGVLPVLAPQQIVDCDTDSYGCNGGWTEHAFNYIESAGGQDTEASYPYTAQDGTCQFNPSNVAAKVQSWTYVTQSGDENAMLQAAYQTGPLSVCVDASSWQDYSGGVLTSCGDSVDHCVQVTGFQNYQGYDVWNVRNSWGSDWGVNGYIYIERGQNLCDIGSDVITVVSNS